MKAILKRTRISPKKANLVAALVRKRKVNEALNILGFTPKRAAKILTKVIKSAAANAKNNFKQDEENLVIKEIIVTEGPTYRRSIPVSRGRVHPILKRTSHITVKVEQQTQKPEKPEKPQKPEKPKTTEEPKKPKTTEPKKPVKSTK